jgi:hypothetical protein
VPTPAEIDEIDAFLCEPKRLQGSPPLWQKASWGDDWEAIWNIEDSLGIVRGQLRCRFPRPYREFPSLSIIFRGNPVYRVDFTPPEICKSNPLTAALHGLPARVCGSHCHTWEDNRDFVLSADIWWLPCRRPIQPQIRRLPQALYWLADQVNLEVGSEQRGFDVPPQTDLFDV